MTEGKTKPDIRFKGFNEDWDKFELKDIADRYDNLRVPITASERIPGDTPYYGANGIQDYVEGFTHDGEFILVAEDGANDLKDYPVQFVNGKIWVNNHAHVLQAKQDIAKNKYLKYVISQTQIEPFLVGGGRAKLNAETMMKLELLAPLNIFEQEKIGEYFNQLDILITLHQRKYDKLTTLNTAMLEKMFPKSGSDVPEIRFKEFTGKWEERKLGEVMEISSASRVHKNEWTDSGVPFFRTSDVISAYYGSDNKKAYISQNLYEELLKKSGSVQKNDLLVTGGGSIGIPFLVKTNEPLYFKDGDLLWLKNTEEINGSFLYTFFSTSTFRNYVNSITHIGTISHYTIEQAKATPFKLPKKEEQEKIAGYFQNHETIITLHLQELEKLKAIKKACLEKMFV
ncbi:MAG: restriction endonuclease subunit S [Bacteroidetes bacterium]|nr:restriction endonuclease subunit S [Bacteroidota bacterium]